MLAQFQRSQIVLLFLGPVDDDPRTQQDLLLDTPLPTQAIDSTTKGINEDKLLKVVCSKAGDIKHG
jgi:hypothetical protein